MDDEVKKIFTEQTWFVATMGDEPNVVPIGFKMVEDDGTMVIADVAMKTTKKNLMENGLIAVTVCDPETKKAYMAKGKATFFEEGELVDGLNKFAEEQGFPFRAKGALTFKPVAVLAKHPGPENDQEIEWI
ncbi:MAG: hypothetical protein BZ137_06465 [Methanosphaera sp. rholeuAM130]|nr:pyridoxamine 5'-phosphate oxidase family protein [Methanosphaera sp.]RAP53578.1 MAG: hypothetical protein BZ137_06465 [Methanosphaera sp. rholeuAM130]